MTTLIFDWSDWGGPATGHVIVTRRTWRRAPESLHVPWQVVLPVDGRATLDVAHVAGEVVSIRWAPKGVASRTDHVLIPDDGEHLAHLLNRVDPSTLEPLPEDLPSAVDLVARAEALVARIESGEFRGEAGRGVVSITAEGETATIRYTDGSVSTLPLPRGPQGEPGRDGVDGKDGDPGVDGRDGRDGRTPDLSWQGTALAVDGVPGPDLRGPAGGPGPAPSLKIGTVTSGTTPSATITGESPDLTLSLVLPKGDPGVKGETGAPGVVSSASSYVIVGPGRPDLPATTGGVITGSEPVGAEYRSTDGANVGAWTWRKRPTGWVVTDGDTGWRRVPFPAALALPDDTFNRMNVRRVGGLVTARVQIASVGGRPTIWTLPDGWRDTLSWANAGQNYLWGNGLGIQLNRTNGANELQAQSGKWHLSWQTDDPWPTAPLPGNPA